VGVQERKEREKAERRRSILDTARDLIREKNFDDVTMEDIAKRLELSRATIYLYFRNKSEIYATLLIEGLQELEEGYRGVLERKPGSPMETLRGFAFVFFQFYARSHHYFDLIVTKRGEMERDLSDEVAAEFKAAGQSVIQPLVDAFAAGAKNGDFPEFPPDKMAYLLRAVAIGFAVGFRVGNLKFPEDVHVAEQLILYGLMGRPPE